MKPYVKPIADGPYRIVKKSGKDRFKLMLGGGLQATFKDSDLIFSEDDVT